MKALHLYTVILFALLASFCAKKKYPDSQIINATIYGFNATIDNTPVSISAGVNNYYMYSSYGPGSDSVYSFVGVLREMNCTNCANSLKIQINDYKLASVNRPQALDSILYPHDFLFASAQLYKASFGYSYNKTAASYAWDFGNGKSSTDANPSCFYDAPGDYAVTLRIKSSGGCESTIRQVKRIEAGSFRANIYTNSNSGDTVGFSPSVTGGQPPYSYYWNFGDGKSSALANPRHTYAIAGSYPVSLKITDANNTTLLAGYNAVTQNDHSSCAVNFTADSISISKKIPASLILSKIIITWTDANGVAYASDSGLQPTDSHFKITSVEDGGVNENNMPIKKLHVVFNCKVYNSARAIIINNAEAVIGVAYK